MIILVVGLIFYVLLGGVRAGPLYFLVAFPGIFLHEFAHFLVALVTNGKPEGINLIPKKEANGDWTLGYVMFEPSWWNAGFVALAPLLLLPLASVVLYQSLYPASGLETLVGGYLLGCFARGAIPSRTDWKIAFRYPAGTAVIFVGFAQAGHAAWEWLHQLKF